MLKATVYSSLDCHNINILIQAPSTHFSYYKIQVKQITSILYIFPKSVHNSNFILIIEKDFKNRINFMEEGRRKKKFVKLLKEIMRNKTNKCLMNHQCMVMNHT
jgi:hypothetical protein